MRNNLLTKRLFSFILTLAMVFSCFSGLKITTAEAATESNDAGHEAYNQIESMNYIEEEKRL